MTIDTLSSLMNLFVWGIGAVYIVDRLLPKVWKKGLEVIGLITLMVVITMVYTKESTKLYFHGGTTISIEVPK